MEPAELLALAGLTYSDFCRFREAWVDSEANELVVCTRENGVDGLSWGAARNPNVISREIDESDMTYVYWRFRLPESTKKG